MNLWSVSQDGRRGKIVYISPRSHLEVACSTVNSFNIVAKEPNLHQFIKKEM